MFNKDLVINTTINTSSALTEPITFIDINLAISLLYNITSLDINRLNGKIVKHFSD